MVQNTMPIPPRGVRFIQRVATGSMGEETVSCCGFGECFWLCSCVVLIVGLVRFFLVLQVCLPMQQRQEHQQKTNPMPNPAVASSTPHLQG